MSVGLAFRPQRRLVGPHELGDRKPALAPARQKLGPRAKRIGKLRFACGRVFAGAVTDDEPAPDREPGLVGERSALPVSRDEPHGVGMTRRRRHGVEHDGALGVEGNCAPPGEVERFRLAHPRDERLGGVEIDGLRRLAAEAQDHRLVGRVAFPREGERAKERDLERGDPVDRARLKEPARERGGGLHRPDRMRRRRTDADLEQFENADHRLTSGGRRLSRRRSRPYHVIMAAARAKRRFSRQMRPVAAKSSTLPARRAGSQGLGERLRNPSVYRTRSSPIVLWRSRGFSARL